MQFVCLWFFLLFLCIFCTPPFIITSYTWFQGVDGQTCDSYVVDNASEYLRNIAGAAENSYTFLHIDLLDAHGHGSGWCGESYLDGVDVVDEWMADLLDAIDDEDGEEWLVTVDL